MPAKVADDASTITDSSVGAANSDEKVHIVQQLQADGLDASTIVADTDNPDLHVDTLRAWTIGLLLSIVGATINELFSERLPHITISHFVAQLVSYPLGIAWARYVPDRTLRCRYLTLALNPGPFNAKEYAIHGVADRQTYVDHDTHQCLIRSCWG